MHQVATGIKTDKWNEIIAGLKKEGWITKREYELFDKGIDYDFIELTKHEDFILFAWDNWFEGELKASEELVQYIETKFAIELEFGESEHLTK